MKKHIAPPATLDQIRRTLGITREDMAIVDRVFAELESEWFGESSPNVPSSEPGNPARLAKSRAHQ